MDTDYSDPFYKAGEHWGRVRRDINECRDYVKAENARGREELRLKNGGESPSGTDMALGCFLSFGLFIVLLILVLCCK